MACNSLTCALATPVAQGADPYDRDHELEDGALPVSEYACANRIVSTRNVREWA